MGLEHRLACNAGGLEARDERKGLLDSAKPKSTSTLLTVPCPELGALVPRLLQLALRLLLRLEQLLPLLIQSLSFASGHREAGFSILLLPPQHALRICHQVPQLRHLAGQLARLHRGHRAPARPGRRARVPAGPTSGGPWYPLWEQRPSACNGTT